VLYHIRCILLTSYLKYMPLDLSLPRGGHRQLPGLLFRHASAYHTRMCLCLFRFLCASEKLSFCMAWSPHHLFAVQLSTTLMKSQQRSATLNNPDQHVAPLNQLSSTLHISNNSDQPRCALRHCFGVAVWVGRHFIIFGSYVWMYNPYFSGRRRVDIVDLLWPIAVTTQGAELPPVACVSRPTTYTLCAVCHTPNLCTP
jgi:hypothetical protein